MTIYILILLLICVYSTTQHKYSNTGRKRIVCASFTMIILFSSLRKWTVGIDLRQYYYKSFIQFLNWEWNDVGKNPYESGYYYLNIFIGKLFGNPQMFIVVTSLMVFLVIGWFIYRNSDNVLMSIFLFIAYLYWFMFLNIIRQAIAVGIILIASEILKSSKLGIKRIPFFVLLVFLASTFHNSAILMLCLLPIYYLKFKRKEILVAILVIVIALLTYDRFFSFAAGLMNHRDYVGAYLDKGELDAGTLTIIMIVLYASVFALGAYRLVWKKRGTKSGTNALDVIQEPYSNDFLMYMALVVLVTRILATRLSIVGRISYYFYPYLLILLPRIERNIQLENNRTVFKVVVYGISLLIFLMVGYTKASEFYGTVPYEFFWQ